MQELLVNKKAVKGGNAPAPWDVEGVGSQTLHSRRWGAHLWGESALRCHVDYQNNLASILGELEVLAIDVLQCKLCPW